MGAEVRVRSVADAKFTQEIEAGKHRLFGDEPELSGGADKGPGPYEYLLAALGTTRDWVVLYWERDGHEDQCTVVTEHQGDLKGRRVVRGRETETRAFYAGRDNQPPDVSPG